MKYLKRETPYGDTIFCDDIRFEADAKTTIIGIYRGEMIVNVGMPGTVVLPKFAMLVSYVERPNESDEPVTIKIFLPGDTEDSPSHSIPVPMESVRSAEMPPNAGEDPYLQVAMPLILAPFLIKQEGTIKVRAFRGDAVAKLGALRVRFNVLPQQPQSAP